jgi:HSP20 family protein
MVTLARRQPFTDFAELHDRLDRLFDRMTDGERGFAPAIDVVREMDRIRIKADVPGIKPDEVKIKAEDGVLTISGEHEESKEEKDDEERYVRRERSYGYFSRSLALPEGVDFEAIAAHTADGVLEIDVPLPPERQKKAVEITPKAAA